MRTSCVRPGCSAPVNAVVLIDRERNVVLLHQPEAGELGAIALCHKHVERFSAPEGWQLRDLRPAAENTSDDVATADLGLQVDDGATPMLGRAFRAASPGELRPAGQSRGYAWVERHTDPEDCQP